jgi:hypothetical protein
MTALADADRRRLVALRGYQATLNGGAAQSAPRTWPAFAEHCLRTHLQRLSDWESDFLESFAARRCVRPSRKQRQVLDRIAARCGVATP